MAESHGASNFARAGVLGGDDFPRNALVLQKQSLFGSAFLEVEKQGQHREADEAQAEKKVKGRGVVPVGRGVDDGAGHQGTDEGRRLADDGEEREEEEFFPARGHFGDHDLAVRVPGADEETVKCLVQPEFPRVMESKPLRPDPNHAPTISTMSIISHGNCR